MSASATQPIQTSSEVDANIRDLSGKYLAFKLADQEYGVEIRKVSEINGVVNITPVPRSLDYMKGVISLRGTIIPVIDLRVKLGLEEAEHTDETCIIVVNVGREVGVVVDSVSEVLDINGEEINPAPPMGGASDQSYILGIGEVAGSMKILIDIKQVLDSSDAENT